MRDCKPILLLEDDTVDAMTVKRALKDINVTNPLVRATNGEEGLAYLRDETKAKPCVILLDINMPKMNGIEFLKIVKADDKLKSNPRDCADHLERRPGQVQDLSTQHRRLYRQTGGLYEIRRGDENPQLVLDSQ